MVLIIPDEFNLPALHSQDDFTQEQLTTYGRLVFLEARITWFLLEIAEDQDTFSAYMIDSRNEQFGYFSFSYLEKVTPKTATITYETLAPTRLLDAVAAERMRRALQYGERQVKTAALAEHRAYYLAAEYSPGEARKVAQAVQAIIQSHKVNLSVFCLVPGIRALVVVIGDRPAEPIHTQIMEALQGKPLITIDYDLLMELFMRKLEENQKGEWRERHVRKKVRRKGKQKRKRS
jgi:polysaccharide pyruvyl transferase WcaK-like protein